jgi:DNA-binding beta-propeller fold protein YncE
MLLSHKRISSGLALAVAVLAASAGSASAALRHAGLARDTGAVFVQTDNPAGNSVVAFHRNADGGLSPAARYATGGLGGVLAGSVTDHLASQGSLVYDRAHGLLFAVNAGSDTVSVFAVRGAVLTLEQVIGSGGSFPVSVAVHGNIVYVLNARDGGILQGYLIVASRLVALPGSARALGLAVNQSPEFVNTPGQVGFSPDGRQLIVTTKANGNDVDVFSVNLAGRLSTAAVVTNLAGAVPFAFAFDAARHLVLTEAATGDVVQLELRVDGTLNLLSSVPTGQAATCWISLDGSNAYASNTGSSTLSTVALGAATLSATTPTDAGTTDSTVTPDGRFLYVQTGIGGILDSFRVNADGSLVALGAIAIDGAVGGEGIVSI